MIQSEPPNGSRFKLDQSGKCKNCGWVKALHYDNKELFCKLTDAESFDEQKSKKLNNNYA
jgi:hypothetical protein